MSTGWFWNADRRVCHRCSARSHTCAVHWRAWRGSHSWRRLTSKLQQPSFISALPLRNVSNKPALLCLLWDNPQTPQSHWWEAGRAHRANPRHPGDRNWGTKTALREARDPGSNRSMTAGMERKRRLVCRTELGSGSGGVRGQPYFNPLPWAHFWNHCSLSCLIPAAWFGAALLVRVSTVWPLSYVHVCVCAHVVHV